MNIRFILRKGAMNKAGTVALNCRITVEGVSTPGFSTGIRVAPKQWDSKNQWIIGKNATVDNETLNEIKNQLKAIRLDFEVKKKPYTCFTIEKAYNGEILEKTFGDAIEMYRELTMLIPNADTKKKNLSIIKNIESFSVAGGSSKKLLEELRSSDIEKILQEMKKSTKFGQNHIKIHLTYMKAILNNAVKVGNLTKNPCEFVTMKKDKVKDIVFLSLSEIATIENLVLPIERLDKVRDLFVFCCYTGLSFADLEKLSEKNIFFGVDDRNWLDLSRTKTGVSAKLPILNKAQAIIDKYGSISNLPLLTNQKYNGYLKEIQDLAGLDKVLTTHIARKTFCSMATNEWNIDIDTVAIMAGHANSSTTRKYYTKVSEKKVAHDMKNIK